MSGRRSLAAPHDLAPLGAPRQHARQYEQQVREAIQVTQRLRAQRLRCATAPSSVARRGGRSSAPGGSCAAAAPPPGSTNSRSGGSSAFQLLDQSLERLDLRGLKSPRSRESPVRRRGRTGRAGSRAAARPSARAGPSQANSTPSALLSSSTRAAGLDARAFLGHARAVGQPGAAVIAGARHDLGKAVAHGAGNYLMWKRMASVTLRPAVL